MRTRHRSVALIAAALSAWPVVASAQSLNAIANLNGLTGNHPYSAVTFDNVVGRAGVLYATTTGGAGGCYEDHGCGTVIQLTPPANPGDRWRLKVLHKFKGPDGDVPFGGLIMDSFGAIYGTTTRGVNPGCFKNAGCGAVFKLTPPKAPGGAWKYSIVYAFKDGEDGGTPVGDLAFDTFGAIYGTTITGGPSGQGTIFKLSPPPSPHGTWTKTLIYGFGGVDGARPRSKLIFDTVGAIYGTTEKGGKRDQGTVFKLTPPRNANAGWTITTLHSFGVGGDGILAYAALIFDTTGALYSTTWKGGIQNQGVAFKLTPPAKAGGTWTYNMYRFAGGLEGGNLQSGLTFDSFGALYGTAHRGGTGNCLLTRCGILFKLIPPKTATGAWQKEVLANFDGTNGGKPLATPVFHQGKMYGTTDFGGSVDLGAVFEFDPN
jgi:uncharacterized repeat protein (TIGR03803 family)